MRVLKIIPIVSVLLIVFLLTSACSGGGGSTTPRPTDTATSVSTEDPYSIQHTRPGPAVDVVEFGSFHVDQAVTELKAGRMDLYLTGLKIAAALQVRDDENIKKFQAPASSISLILNPAPAREGALNPFSIKEVRQAMNWLVDRQFIVNDIYGGLAVVQQGHVSILEHDYLTVAPVFAPGEIRYNLAFAQQQISDAMRDAGAELVDGKWHYNNKLIRIKFVIRVEDERREVGDTIRQALEQVGFQVEPAYKNFAAAIFTVYTSDPSNFEWHLYTEGWGKSGTNKYDFASINQMTAPWMGNMPGWQIVGYWQYQNERLDKLGKQLFTGDFSSQQERDEIYRAMTEIALDESVRIWVATVFNTFPAADGVYGVTRDITSGPKSMLTLREAYVEGSNKLRVGNLWVWTERSTWNPVGGFGDVYSIDIWKNLVDPPLMNHPFQGIPVPYRADFEITSEGPSSKLAVPTTAVMWNAETDRWESVGVGVQAMSRVVFDYSKYFQSTWHHGADITMADVVYQLSSLFERTYDADKSRIEFVQAFTQRPLLDQFRGFELLDDNRLAVYLDFWHFEESYIASYASLTSLPVPWELQAAMDNLVFEKRQAAYSQSASARYNVPWLSLVMKRDASFVTRVLKEFKREGALPASALTINGEVLTTSQEAQERYDATLEWFEQYEHLVISQGPFILARFDPPAQYARLEAFRGIPVLDEKGNIVGYEREYPFKPGDWYFGVPPSLEITDIQVPSSLRAGESGEVLVTVSGPDNVDVTYVLVDPATSTAVASGTASPRGSETFSVPISSEVTSAYSGKRLFIHVFATSDEVVLVKSSLETIEIR